MFVTYILAPELGPCVRSCTNDGAIIINGVNACAGSSVYAPMFDSQISLFVSLKFNWNTITLPENGVSSGKPICK